MSRKPVLVGSLIGLAGGILTLLALGYLNVLLNFCLDLDLFEEPPVDDCVDENRRMGLWFALGVVPASLAVGVACGRWTTRALRRRARRNSGRG